MSATTETLRISSAPTQAAYRVAWAALLLFAVSGATGLMLEVVWSRMLVTLLGATSWGVLAVLVAYMGGLGLGALLLGGRASASARPLRLYGLLELAVGVYTLAVPLLFQGIKSLYVATSQVFGDSYAAGLALRLLAALLVLAPPTVLMGGTLPALTRALAAEWGRPGRSAGLLYAVNTLGAMFGCAVTGFFLIVSVGVSATNWLAAALDLAVGALALLLAQRLPAVAPEPSQSARPAEPSSRHARGGSLALVVACYSGFCGLAYEVLWTRGLLAALTDSTTYAFTLMLATFLAGHAVGSRLANALRGERAPSATWRLLGRAQVFAGITALVSVPILVLAREVLLHGFHRDWSTFWNWSVPFQLVTCLAVVALPAGLLGASFPLAAQLYVGQGRAVGSSTGRLYGFNTLGAIAGATCATLWLVPALGTQGTLVVLAMIQVLLGVLVVVPASEASARASRLYESIVLAIVCAGAVLLNTALPLSALYASKEPGRLLATVEGPGAIVTVHQRREGDRVININGVNVAGTLRVLQTTQKLQGHLPLFLHQAPRDVLQIGFGSGGTCRAIALHDEIRSIDVCELIPEVLPLARRWFADVNRGVLDDPRVRVVIGDARSYLEVTPNRYDLILSDSIHPRFRGNATLYTRDYFALCARRLRPHGLVSTWLPLYGMSVDDVRGILRSMQAVFPHIQLWYPNTEPNENTVLIASFEPIEIDPARLAAEMALPAIAADLASVGIKSPIQLLNFFLLHDRAIEGFARGGPISTDDHPMLEFLAPRTVRRQQSFIDNFNALRAAREPVAGALAQAPASLRAELAQWHAGTTEKLAGEAMEIESRFPEAAAHYERSLQLNPLDRELRLRLQNLKELLGPAGRAR